ncbi:MAG: type II toxin-antitoxin system RelE/ParE family toxin [Bacteroidetes bacterium]|nr:type II toxin-antitoxin system RelE/ParE family toxin [Bacteroidota bacterium]
MHKYSVVITKTARKQLDKLPDNISEKLLDVIISLSYNPRPIGHKKLKNRDGYRVRKGDYRIIYDIFDNILVIDIIAVGHRKNIYE